MSEWQMPEKAMSMATSRGPSNRRWMDSDSNRPPGDRTPRAVTPVAELPAELDRMTAVDTMISFDTQ
jgi:hypothetical protein